MNNLSTELIGCGDNSCQHNLGWLQSPCLKGALLAFKTGIMSGRNRAYYNAKRPIFAAHICHTRFYLSHSLRQKTRWHPWQTAIMPRMSSFIVWWATANHQGLKCPMLTDMVLSYPKIWDACSFTFISLGWKMRVMRPSSSVTNVVRKVPIVVLPYIFFSP